MSSSLEQLDINEDGFSLQAAIDDLINRAKILNEEVDIYVKAVDSNQNMAKVPMPVEYRTLRNDFRTELAFLEKKFKTPGLTEEQARHYFVSSNFVYYEGLWEAAKRSTGLLSFRKYYFWNKKKEGHKEKSLSMAKRDKAKGKSAALVDIVAADGMEWVRLSTTSEKRLLFDLAKLGWRNDSDEEDEDMPDAEPMNWEDEDDTDEVTVVKNARELARAARANPIRGRPPQVRIVLTRIIAGKTKEVDAVIAKIRATGAIVECANEISPARPLSDVLPNLLLDRSRILSSVLNIDCTILLALISDISHKPCEILDWYPGEVRAQILEEEKEKLLPTHLYPAIGSHPMVTTQEAANQMILIVETLATDSEKTRANLLLGQHEYQDVLQSELLKVWGSMSDHPIPEGLQLPIRVVPSNMEENMGRLPVLAEKIAAELTPLNTAIFFYGWAEGLTTLSSNRARARQIEHVIKVHGLEDGQAGPHIWLCGESRSLIAKQGRRK